MTPRQVQRVAGYPLDPFLLSLGSPASELKPAGKGTGCRHGYRPDQETELWLERTKGLIASLLLSI